MPICSTSSVSVKLRVGIRDGVNLWSATRDSVECELVVPGNHESRPIIRFATTGRRDIHTHSVVGGDEVVGCRLIDMVLGDYRDGFDCTLSGERGWTIEKTRCHELVKELLFPWRDEFLSWITYYKDNP